jgi:O-antigen/teichoic acid export membrane protein
MQERSKYLLKNIFSFLLGKMGPRLITFFMVPLYTYTLTTEEYGTIDLVSTLCTVLMPILILNISDAVMRFALDQGADHHKLMSIGISVLGVGTLVGLVLIPISNLLPVITEYSLALYGYTISSAYMQVFCSYLRGKEKLNAYAIGNIFHTGCIVGLNLLFLLVFHWGVRGYILANVLANLLTAVYAAVVGRVDEVLKDFHPDRKLFVRMVRYSALLIPSTMLWWIIQSSDRIMVSYMIGAAANGIYAVAYKLPSLLSTLASIFNQAWVYSAIREKDSTDVSEYYNQMYDRMVQVLLILTSGIFLIIKPFLSIYVAPEYYSAWKYTPFLLIGFAFLALAGFMGTFSTVHKDSKAVLKTSSVGAIVNLVLNFLTIPYFGAAGAAFATCVCYIAVFVYRVIHTHRHYVKINVLQPKHLVGFVALVAMGFALFMKGVIGQILLIVLFALCVYLSKDFILQMMKRLRRKA